MPTASCRLVLGSKRAENSSACVEMRAVFSRVGLSRERGEELRA